MAQSAEYAAEIQRLIRNKSRPIGNTTRKPRVLAIQEDLNEDSLDALVLNAINRAFKKRNFNTGNSGNRNQGRSGPAQGAKPKLQKQCTYSRKT